MMSLPRVFDCSSWPLRRPSPAATMRTMETIPQAIPNMVRNVRSLCDHKVRKTSRMRSLRTMDACAGRTFLPDRGHVPLTLPATADHNSHELDGRPDGK